MSDEEITDKYYRVYLTKSARLKLRSNILFRSFLINEQYFKCIAVGEGDARDFIKLTFPYHTPEGSFSIDLQVPTSDILYLFSFPEEQKRHIVGFVKEEQSQYLHRQK